MAKQKIRLMFNASNGAVIGAIPSGMSTGGLNPNEVKIKSLDYDPEIEVYYGDYETGSIQKIADLDKAPDAAIIDEDMLNIDVKNDIQHVYPIHRQLNILIDMLDNSEIANTEEFNEMKNYIEDIRERNKARKEAFKSNPNSYKFITRQQIQKDRRRRLGLD
jgi:hypothetical protein